MTKHPDCEANDGGCCATLNNHSACRGECDHQNDIALVGKGGGSMSFADWFIGILIFIVPLSVCLYLKGIE